MADCIVVLGKVARELEHARCLFEKLCQFHYWERLSIIDCQKSKIVHIYSGKRLLPNLCKVGSC
jgi:hypothetical protein